MDDGDRNQSAARAQHVIFRAAPCPIPLSRLCCIPLLHTSTLTQFSHTHSRTQPLPPGLCAPALPRQVWIEATIHPLSYYYYERGCTLEEKRATVGIKANLEVRDVLNRSELCKRHECLSCCNYNPVEAGNTCDPLPNWTMFSTWDMCWHLTVWDFLWSKDFAHPRFYDIIKHDDSSSKLHSVDSQSEALMALCQFITVQ